MFLTAVVTVPAESWVQLPWCPCEGFGIDLCPSYPCEGFGVDLCSLHFDYKAVRFLLQLGCWHVNIFWTELKFSLWCNTRAARAAQLWFFRKAWRKLEPPGFKHKSWQFHIDPLSVENVASDRQSKPFVFFLFVNAPARVLLARFFIASIQIFQQRLVNQISKSV